MSQAKPKIVMVFGTFDDPHPGHLDFFRQAKALTAGGKLIVSVARDENVVRVKAKNPKFSHHQRKKLLEKIPEIDKVVIGALRKSMSHIVRAKPDIIALGYDQSEYIENLRKELRLAGLSTKVVRLKPYKPHLYKTSLLSKLNK